MPMLHTALRFDLDEASLQQHELVGIKLDKAKCFDRIIPSHTSALFLAFGLPKGLVNIFSKMYRGLRRHMSYKGWICPHPTTASNGVAQGCSLSLIAVNVQTKVWVHLLQHLPHVTMRAYIDDAYLWCRLIHVAELYQAIRLTKLWDELSGQKLNDSKSVVWGTTTNARKTVQQTFPGMKQSHTFDALGVKIYTTNKDDCEFSETKLQKFTHTVECIGALPVPMKVKAFLIGSKAIPAVTYGAHISRIPKQAIRKMQNAIVKALWNGRPMARSKWLVQLFHGQPHRTDPQLAQAYVCIMDLVRFCHHDPSAVTRLQTMWHAKETHKHTLINKLASACQVLGLTLTSQIALRFRDSDSLSLRSATPHDVSQVLKHIARQCAYELAGNTQRKDFVKPGGLLDFHASTSFLRKPTFSTPCLPSATSHCESVIVGCTLTRDRLHAAG